MSLKKSRQDMKVYLLEDYVEAAAGDHSEDDEDAPAMLAQLYWRMPGRYSGLAQADQDDDEDEGGYQATEGYNGGAYSN